MGEDVSTNRFPTIGTGKESIGSWVALDLVGLVTVRFTTVEIEGVSSTMRTQTLNSAKDDQKLQAYGNGLTRSTFGYMC